VGVKVGIHPFLQEFTNGQDTVEVKGKNVRECLENVDRLFPGFSETVMSPNRKLFKHIEIYVNGKDASPGELTKSVTDGDEISIIFHMGCGG